MIDEAQKVPLLFDTVKFFVDQNPRPGQFVLAGSTEFSIKSNIRESLTGRAATLRMFPLTVGETLRIPPDKVRLFPPNAHTRNVNRAQLMRYLTQGGMPGMFFVHEKAERNELMSDWLQLTTQRDIQQLPGPKKDPSLAHDILQHVAILEDPTVLSLAKSLRVSARKINSHVDALRALFALVELRPSRFGTGKPRLYLCDVGFASYFGASFKRQLQTFFLQELLARQSNFEKNAINNLCYYRTSKGSLIDFIFQDAKSTYHCVKIHDRESITQLDVRILTSLSKKLDQPVSLICAAGVSRSYRMESVTIMPWESIS
jgi:predicted AAA+ superfamily ATPase